MSRADIHPLARVTGNPRLFEGPPIRAAGLARRRRVTHCEPYLLHLPRRRDGVRLGYRSPGLEELYHSAGAESDQAELCGIDYMGPSGAGVWTTPIIDAKRREIYFGTGNAFPSRPLIRFADGHESRYREDSLVETGQGRRYLARRLRPDNSGTSFEIRPVPDLGMGTSLPIPQIIALKRRGRTGITRRLPTQPHCQTDVP